MPYSTLVSGTTITASWANANVRDQVVTPFASAAARTSAITVPVTGMLSWQTDIGGFMGYDGVGWVGRVPTKVIANKTADETVNNSATLQNDDFLSWAVAANATYLLRLQLFYSTAATPNIKIGWTFPASLTMKVGVIGIDTTSAFVSNSGYDQTTVISFGPGTSPERMVVVFARVNVSATAGTLQLQWAQNTANASNTIIRDGSHGVLTRIV